MAITRNAIQVTWDTGSNTDTVGAGANTTSDNISLSANCVEASILLKAEYTAASPASDDIIHFWWLMSTGDPDAEADSSDEYSTPPQAAGQSGGALHLAVLDVSKGETSGSGKMMKVVVPIPPNPQEAQLYADGAEEGNTNTITISAQIEETLAA